MVAQQDVDRFLNSTKLVVGTMDWQIRHGGGAHVSQLALEYGGLIVGDLVAVQLPGVRAWKFSARMQGAEVLRWEFLPLDAIRKHRNPKPLPPGFDGRDRSLAHEHPFVAGGCGPYSRPIAGLDAETTRHRTAFESFCERANIVSSGYVDPPEPQLVLLP